MANICCTVCNSTYDSDNAKKAKSLIKKIDDRPVLINFAKRRQEQKLMDAESDDDEDDYELQTSKEADDKPKNSMSNNEICLLSRSC